MCVSHPAKPGHLIMQRLPIVTLIDRGPDRFDLLDKHALGITLRPIGVLAFYRTIACENFSELTRRIPASAITMEERIRLFAILRKQCLACPDQLAILFDPTAFDAKP